MNLFNDFRKYVEEQGGDPECVIEGDDNTSIGVLVSSSQDEVFPCAIIYDGLFATVTVSKLIDTSDRYALLEKINEYNRNNPDTLVLNPDAICLQCTMPFHADAKALGALLEMEVDKAKDVYREFFGEDQFSALMRDLAIEHAKLD